jgi:hypothetical protein
MGLDNQDLAQIDALIMQRLAESSNNVPIGFVPGITTPIGQPQVLPFVVPTGGGTFAAQATDQDAQTLSSEAGMLWQEVSVESTGIFEWNMKFSGYDELTLDGKKISSTTFAGEGSQAATGDLVWGHKLPTAMYLPGSTQIILTVTDLSGNPNAVRATLTGSRVRPGSQFEADMIRMLAYNGMG